MKYIVKQDEPGAFTSWKSRRNPNWHPNYNNLSGEPKKALKTALQAEQGYICCYCEQRLTDKDSHIEHLRPQSDPSVDPLDYGNLLCSCQNQVRKGEPRHCGNLKEDWFDQNLLVSPLDPDCEIRFAFTGDGSIKPMAVDDVAASETIKRLGLNIPKLNALRENAIAPFLDEDLTHEELQTFVTGYLVKAAAGQFGEFWTTIHYLFKDYVSV